MSALSVFLEGGWKALAVSRCDLFNQGRQDAEADIRDDCHEFFFDHLVFRRYANERLPRALRGVDLSEYEKGYASVYDTLSGKRMAKLIGGHASPFAMQDLATSIINGILR